MASTVRLIARLDIKGPNLIKGIQFDGYRVLGSPDFFANMYYQEGIDELIYQDAVASLYQRNSLLSFVKQTARQIFVPLTVAGGIRSIDNVSELLRAGADKVAINTAAVQNPNLLKEASRIFGSQCIVASIEAYRYRNGKYEIWTDYGRQETGLDAFYWAQKVVDLGVGEILLTSINKEGTGRGFDIELTQRIAEMVPVPVISAGGAGDLKDIIHVIKQGQADAVAVASMLHYYYSRPIQRLTMQFNERRLRMGEEVDSGNIDFLNFGYGGYKAIPVVPHSITEMKQAMIEAGIPTRTIISEVKMEDQ
ncbi:MAG: imidazole glycerol phosphate synthase subunit HisF [SAR324 cluster bacterium]|uniref:imidazole glycerol-phosphate synthase n=1 Tax=SAR324 cluster bacterium TaxID=2024889 RepID=A0A7X9FQL0_9DELT|nr:imidazole glycerol phosphate synthase subunit HisF [SAR324 cluster bacterium]